MYNKPLEDRERKEKVLEMGHYEKLFGTEKFDKEIEKMSYEEKERLIAHIEFLLREGDPSKKSFWKNMQQSISMKIGTPPTFDPKFRNILGETYTIEGHTFFIKIHDGGWETSKLMDIGINPNKFTYKKIYLIKCSTENTTAWTNLRIFILGNKESNERKFLYIGDRYVIESERGKGMGKCLLNLIDNIAKDLCCEIIFGSLVPEEGEDLEKLKKGHKDFGYTIEDQNGAQIAIKKLQ